MMPYVTLLLLALIMLAGTLLNIVWLVQLAAVGALPLAYLCWDHRE